jgi:hypothetical protein
MPITSSQGSLAYSRAILSVDYEYWYLQSTNSVPFYDIDIDSNDNIYTLSDTSAAPESVVTYTFKQYDDFPYTIVNGLGYTHLVTLGNGAGHTNTAFSPTRMEYNEVNGKLILLNNETTREPTVFPYDPARIGALTIPGPNSISTTSVGKFAAVAGGGGTPTVTYMDMSCDSSTGTTYLAGYADIQSGSSSYFFVKKFSNLTNLEQTSANINSPESLFAPSYQTTGSTLTRTAGVVHNASGLYSCNTRNADVSTRQTFVTKLDPTPTLLGGLYYMPAIWQRQLTDTLTLEVAKISGINEATVTLNDTGTTKYGYVVQYNSSGVLQWQRRITNVQLKDNVTDSSGNIYVVGVNTSNQLFIAKYNSSGTLQWQRVLTGQTYIAQSIKIKDNNIYVCGIVGSNGFMVKLPDDGSIPGSGTYTLGTITLTYIAGSQAEIAGTLTDSVGNQLPNLVTNDRYRSLNKNQTSTPVTRTTISLSQV